jgi:hypothetical protein
MKHALWIAALVLAGISLVVAGPNDPPEINEAITEGIQMLHSSEIANRDQGSAALIAVGAPAVPAVEQLLDSKDAEVKTRAEHILNAIHVNATAADSIFPTGEGFSWTYTVSYGTGDNQRTEERTLSMGTAGEFTWNDSKTGKKVTLNGFALNGIQGDGWVVVDVERIRLFGTAHVGFAGTPSIVPIGEYRWDVNEWSFQTMQGCVAMDITGKSLDGEEKVVPAGAFSCKRAQITDGSTTTTAWFAKGVGLVRMQVMNGNIPTTWELTGCTVRISK